MTAINVCVVGGHLGQEPRISETSNGRKMMNFNVAVNRSKEIVDWIPIQMSGPQVSDFMTENIHKSTGVLVEGRFEHASYIDKNGVRKDFNYVSPSVVKLCDAQMNVICVEGNLTRDPELRQSASGKSVVNFTVACNRQYKDKNGEWKDAPTSFLEITAWEKTAEYVCNNFHKGSTILVSGSIQSRSFTTKDGEKRTAYDVVANHVTFAGRKTRTTTDEAKSASKETATQTTKTAPTYAVDDFVPVDNTGDLEF